MIYRTIEKLIIEKSKTGKAIIILGPRQTGKTTLLNKIARQEGEYKILNCDDPYVKELLEGISFEKLRQLVGTNTTIFIDEAQRIKNIGLTLKLITDGMKDINLYVSGSSSLDIANEINEPLTGRKWEYILYPISWAELHNHVGYINTMPQLEQRLIYGMYPEVVNNAGNEKEILKQITSSYLYKDILSYKGIRKPEILDKLLKALAFQVGKLVSYNELANMLQIDKNTVSHYLDLLEKVYVIFRLQPFSRNLRNEIISSRKIYFYDIGVRNCIINNFNPLSFRDDIGVLWENFMVAERMKYLHYNRIFANTYFWRTQQQQEIDFIEERDGKLFAFEFKWKQEKKDKFPSSFTNHYIEAETQVIHHQNFLPFLGIE